MAHSVRSHSPVPEIRLDLKNGAVVECHKNSVFRIHADILVVSRNGSVESGVRQKIGWQEWDKRKKKFPTTSDWKSVKISTSDCQSNFHFSKVYVVAVPVYIKANGKKWLEEYENLINNLLTRTENRGMTSITIPLLGTNAGGAPKEGCVRRVMDAVFKFPKFKSLRKINVVVQGWPEVTLVQDLMAEKSGQTSDAYKYKNITQNNLIPSSKSHDTLAPRNDVVAVDDEKSNKEKENCAEPDNRVQSLSQQTHAEDPENRSIARNKMVDSSNNEEELKSRHQNGNFDNKKSHHVRDMESEKMGASKGRELIDVNSHHCSNCGHYKTSRFVLSCSHVFCIFCAPGVQDCPLCKVDKEKSNKEEENGAEPSNRDQRSRERTHSDDRTQTLKKNYCKNCAKYTYATIFDLPCKHICCSICLPYNRSCPLCKVHDERCNKEEENGAEPGNRIPSSRQQILGEDLTQSVKKYHCKSCLGETFIELKEMPCHHLCCFRCFTNLFCQQCKAQLSNKEEENGTERENRMSSSKEQTLGEDRGKYHCKSCSSYTSIKLSVLPCQHFCCFLCKYRNCQQCKTELFNKETEKKAESDNRIPNGREQTNGEDRGKYHCKSCLGYTFSKLSELPCHHFCCYLCDKQSCQQCKTELSKKEKENKAEPDNRIGGDNTMKEKCHRCDSSLANNSPVQLGCGHTVCARCSAKGCIDPSCKEEPEYEHDINLKESRFSQDLSVNHSNRRSDTSEPNDRDTIMDNHSSRDWNGSDGNHRDRHSSRDRNGSDHNPRSRNRNGSDGNHRDRPSSRDRNGSDHYPSSRDRNDSDGNHSDKHSNSSRHRDGSVHKYTNSSRGQDGSVHKHRNNSRGQDGSVHKHRNNSRGQDGSVHKHRIRDRNGSEGNHSKRDWHEGEGHDYREGRPKYGEDNLPPKDAEKTEMCAICMDHITDPKKLDKCGHEFCRECIDDCFKLHKPVCPSCGTMYGVTIGNMPPGTMDVRKSSAPIESFKKYGSYCITYQFNSGIQGSEHPNPGVEFNGTTRTAYLPASPKGIEVCKMLKVAFKRCLTFTIGRSPTTGRENVIIWNDIHHKISMIGGPTQFGYPDPTYLKRVKEELASKGVTLADIDGVSDETEFITVP